MTRASAERHARSLQGGKGAENFLDGLVANARRILRDRRRGIPVTQKPGKAERRVSSPSGLQLALRLQLTGGCTLQCCFRSNAEIWRP